MAGKAMWNEMVNANWILARSRASNPNMAFPQSSNTGHGARRAQTAKGTGCFEYDYCSRVQCGQNRVNATLTNPRATH